MYTFKVLPSKDYDVLPYKRATDSLGLADTNKKLAYIRDTKDNEITKYLINHELDHLIGKNRDKLHEGESGVYYKVFPAIFNALSTMGGGLSQLGGGLARGLNTLGGGLAGATKGIGQGIGGLFNQFQPQQGLGALRPTLGTPGVSPQGISSYAFKQPPAQSFAFKQAPQAVQQARQPFNFQQNLMQKYNPQKIFNAFGPGASPQQAVKTAGQGGPFQGSSVANVVNQLFSGFNPSLQMPPQAQAQFAGPISGVAQGAAQGQLPSPQPPPQVPGTVSQLGQQAQQTVQQNAQGGGLSDILKQVFNPDILAGLGFAGVGDVAAPKVGPVPDFQNLPSVNALKNLNIRNFQELDPALQQAVEHDLTLVESDEEKKLRRLYKSLRPGADIESDSSFRRDIFELQDMQGRRRVETLAKVRFEWISHQLQASELEMRQLSQLAELDITQIMLQLGLDAEEANQFKQTFGDIGKLFLLKGLGYMGAPKQEETANAV